MRSRFLIKLGIGFWLAVLAVFSVETCGAVEVGSAAELAEAVRNANRGGDKKIVVRDGVYVLDQMLWVEAEGVSVAGQSGHRDRVVIQGRGMDGKVTHVFNVAGSFFSLRDMSLSGVSQHLLQLQPSADFCKVENVKFSDAGEQLFKAAWNKEAPEVSPDNGHVENCLFEYTAGVGPQYYIGGIDVHRGRNWVVRRCRFENIRSPGGQAAEHAVHFWSEAENTLVERNIIVNCDRGVGFGLGDRGHKGGIIRNNMIYHGRMSGFGDVGVGLESAQGAMVYNNTIFLEHGYDNAIEHRFDRTRNVFIANNLTNRRIVSRDRGRAEVKNNRQDAEKEWFVNPGNGNLRLKAAVESVVDKGIPVKGLSDDIDGKKRPVGRGCDIGAFEYEP